MSGGHFDHKDGWLAWQAEDLELDVAEMEKRGDCSEITLEYLKGTARIMRLCAKRMHVADWFLSADDGEDTFQKRMAELIAERSSP